MDGIQPFRVISNRAEADNLSIMRNLDAVTACALSRHTACSLFENMLQWSPRFPPSKEYSMPSTKDDLPIHIHANPGWLWIVWVPVMGLNLPFMLQVGLTHPGVILILTCFLSTLVGMTVWMVHVPHVTVTTTGVTIRHCLGQTDVPFGDITTWGTSFGTLYVQLTDGRKIKASMLFYVDQPDRERLFTALTERGFKKESPRPSA